MNSEPCQWNKLPADIWTGTGVFRYGVSDISPVDETAVLHYRQWIARHRHGTMQYMERYAEVRDNPHLLLEGAESIISCAIPYHTPLAGCAISSYALGDDYHEVVRNRLETVAERVRGLFGGETRVCVDTAPIRERYWAVRAGLGFIGINNQLIIPGAGSYFFLGEILTTVRLKPTAPLPDHMDCGRCGRCVRACPTRAIMGDGSIDTSRCLSYLTIEHKGDLPEGTDLHGCLYGCDTCARVCPHNAHPPTDILPEFTPRPAVAALTAAQATELTQEQFSTMMRHSAIKRTKRTGPQRNAQSNLKQQS